MNRAHLVILIGLITVGAFHTSPGGTFNSLGHLSDEIKQSWALDVSADGKVVVGSSASSGSPPFYTVEAFRWTEETGMVSLGLLNSGDTESQAFAVSAGGFTVVGSSLNRSASVLEAFRWTSESGMRSALFNVSI